VAFEYPVIDWLLTKSDPTVQGPRASFTLMNLARISRKLFGLLLKIRIFERNDERPE
jgi:hypothetical protein